MREILFRGKRVDTIGNGEWIEGYYAAEPYTKNTYNYGYILENEKDLFAKKAWLVDSRTVGQFTGLTDKNGRKIFEGDIVKTSHGGSTYYAKIEWDDGSFWVTNHDIQMPSYISEVSKTYLEIIGNIHDNPELLEVTE